MKFMRLLGFPFAVIYGAITSFRNLAYNRGWLKSSEFSLPVICVGNLSVGGTGKSPMTAYIVRLLKDDRRVAVLSRGYGRRTRGYLEVNLDHTADQVGDEPLQLKQNYPDVLVAVCADRREGIKRLKQKADVVVLDDAFQHRRVKPSYSILLTAYDKLYTDDYLLPMGRLREPITSAKRADMIVVTKCPDRLPYARLQQVQFKLKPEPGQRVYFSRIAYADTIYSKSEQLALEYLKDKPFTLVTGIANPIPLVDYLRSNGFIFDHKKYPDHHRFTKADLKWMAQKEILLTTEKDYMRLQPHVDKYAFYYLPIQMQILNEQEEYLKQRILNAAGL